MKPEYTLVTDAAQVQQVVVALARQPILAVDSETEGLEPLEHKLVLVQVASPRHAYLFPATLDLSPLAALLGSPSRLKLIQRAEFDYGFLRQYLGVETRPVWCTRLADQLLGTPEKEAGLKHLAQRYCGLDLAKGDVTVSFRYGQEFTEEQLTYAALDALVLHPIYTAQERALRPRNRCPLVMARVAAKLDAERDRLERGEKKVF